MSRYEQLSIAIQALTVLSLIATTIITAIYVAKTSSIAEAARQSAEQQTEVAATMLLDIAVRNRPHVRWFPGTRQHVGDAESKIQQNGRLINFGHGFAVDLSAMLVDSPTSKQGTVFDAPPLLEVKGEVPLSFRAGDHDFVRVEFQDSASMYHYQTVWAANGACVLYERTAIKRDIPHDLFAFLK